MNVRAELLALSARYAGFLGRDYATDTAWREYDASHARAVASWYLSHEDSPGVPTSAVLQWEQLGALVSDQYDRITALGITHTVVSHDPYVDASDLTARVLETAHIDTMASVAGDHPVWSAATNDKFRAVHDLLGHVANGYDFSREGEDSAYRAHASTLPGTVRGALATETRCQSAALNFGPDIDDRAPGTFAKQIAVPAPRWISDWNLS